MSDQDEDKATAVENEEPETPEAEPDSAETEAEAPKAGGGDEQEQRLQELDEQIRKAEQKAEETLGEPGQEFHESGNEQAKEEDDQTIAPPG